MTLAPRFRRFRNVVIFASGMGGVGVYVACADFSVNDVRGCTAGATKECACSGGHASTATCFADGSYGACACGPLPDAGPLPGDANDAGETSDATADVAAESTADAASEAIVDSAASENGG